jgi:hypothetical protein
MVATVRLHVTMLHIFVVHHCAVGAMVHTGRAKSGYNRRTFGRAKLDKR